MHASEHFEANRQRDLDDFLHDDNDECSINTTRVMHVVFSSTKYLLRVSSTLDVIGVIPLLW